MTDPTINGNAVVKELDELEQLAQRDSQRIAARQESVRVVEPTEPSALPFDQKAHDEMIQSIDRVATDWVGELEHVRKNSQAVEQLVLQRAAKVKADITALYLLGNAALAEAKRGDDVNHRLADELDKLVEHQA
jgi:hypothetical protein